MIHVLDELSVRPGSLGSARSMVRDEYLPLAASHGFTLTHTWIAPAVELRDEPTDLLLLWSCADTDAYWLAKNQSARDPELATFWERIAPLVTARRRRILADPDDPGVLR